MGKYSIAATPTAPSRPGGKYSRAREEEESPIDPAEALVRRTGAQGTISALDDALGQMDPRTRINRNVARRHQSREREIEQDYESQGAGPEAAEFHNRLVRETRPYVGDPARIGEGLSESVRQAKNLNLEGAATGLVEAGKGAAPAALAGLGAGVLRGATAAAKAGNLGKYGKMLAAEVGVGTVAEKLARAGLNAAGVPEDISTVLAFVGTLPISAKRIADRARKLAKPKAEVIPPARDFDGGPDDFPDLDQLISGVDVPPSRTLAEPGPIEMPPVSRVERRRAELQPREIPDDVIAMPAVEELPIELPPAGADKFSRANNDLSYQTPTGDRYGEALDTSRAGLLRRMDATFDELRPKLAPEPEPRLDPSPGSAVDALLDDTWESPAAVRETLTGEPAAVASRLSKSAADLPRTGARELLLHEEPGQPPVVAPRQVDGQELLHTDLAEATGRASAGERYDTATRARVLINDVDKTATVVMSSPDVPSTSTIQKLAADHLDKGYEVKVQPLDETTGLQSSETIDYTDTLRRIRENVPEEISTFVDDVLSTAERLGSRRALPAGRVQRQLAAGEPGDLPDLAGERGVAGDNALEVIDDPLLPDINRSARARYNPDDFSGPRGLLGTVDFPEYEDIAFPNLYGLRKTLQSTLGLLRSFGESTPQAIADRILDYSREYDSNYGKRQLEIAKAGLVPEDLPARDIIRGTTDAKTPQYEDLLKVADMLDADRPSHIPPEQWGDVDPELVTLAAGVRKILDDVGSNARDVGLLSFVDDQGNLVEMWRDGYFPHVVYAPDKLRSTGKIQGKNLLRTRVVEDAVRRGSFKSLEEGNAVLDAWIKLSDDAGKVREYARSLRKGKSTEELSNESIKELVNDMLQNPDGHPDWKGKLDLDSYKDVLDWTVNSNQAQDPVDAFRKLMANGYDPQRAVFSSISGSLEKGREINLPFYEPDPAQAVTSYVRTAERRMAFVRQFSKSGEVLSDFIDRVTNIAGNRKNLTSSQVENHIREIIHTAVDTPYHRMKELHMSSNVSDTLRQLQLLKLTFAPMLNLVQVPIGQAMALKLRGASVDTMKAAVQALITDRRGARTRAVRAGALANEMQSKFGAQDIGSGESRLSRGLSSMVEHTLRIVGFSGSEEFNRVWAANIAGLYAKRLSKGLRAKGRDSLLAREQLERWNLNPDEIARRPNSGDDVLHGFTADEVEAMAWHINRDVNFSSRSGDMPFTATQDPLWKAVYQFTTFSRSMTELSIDFLGDTARAMRAAAGAEGKDNITGGMADTLNAMITLAVAMPVVGSIAAEARQEQKQAAYDATAFMLGMDEPKEAREPDTFVDALTDGRMLEALLSLPDFDPDDPEQMKLFADVTGRWFESIATIGTLGMFHDALEAVEYRGLSNFLIGPSASSMLDVMQKSHSAASKKLDKGDPLGALTDMAMAGILAIAYSAIPFGTVLVPSMEEKIKQDREGMGDAATPASLGMP